jgi:hypothetical protein
MSTTVDIKETCVPNHTLTEESEFVNLDYARHNARVASVSTSTPASVKIHRLISRIVVTVDPSAPFSERVLLFVPRVPATLLHVNLDSKIQFPFSPSTSCSLLRSLNPIHSFSRSKALN